jgi:hypothetical protein
MKRYICMACDDYCEIIEDEQGGMEEFWGRPVFHSQMADVSDCCREDWEEVEEE